MDLHEPVAHQQRRRNARLDRFLVLPAHQKPVDHGIHVRDLLFVQLRFRGNVDSLTVDNQNPATLLTNLSKNEVQILAILLENRRSQLHMRALRQRQERFQNLAASCPRAQARRCAGNAARQSSRTTD